MWYKIWSRGPETEFLKEKLKSDYSGLVFVEAHMVLHYKSTILNVGEKQTPSSIKSGWHGKHGTHIIFAHHKDKGITSSICA